MNEAPIADYALIGDTRTAALCTSTGSIDWMCAPAFDSEPLFGKLVGGPAAGSFAITIDDVVQRSRKYLGSGAVLETTIGAANGRGRLTEGMVVEVERSLLPQTVLVRRLTCDAGQVAARIRFDPKRGFAGRSPRAARRAGSLVCEWGSVAVALQSFPEIEISPGDEVVVELDAGTELTMVMTIADRSPAVLVGRDRAAQLLERTGEWWERWSANIDYDGPFRGAVLRSLITLQLLTFSPSGAPIAAPTTSLPEQIGGGRNWDYRFSWPRDASIGLAAFLALGQPDLAHSFMHWLLHSNRLSRPRVKVLYTLYGKAPPKEREVRGVPGYRASLPVRIGNEARTQHQLDVYGWVVDAAWLMTKSGHELHPETWRAIRGMADFVVRHWEEPDAGIWEVRGRPAHYVHSKMMAWLCLDRALGIAAIRGVQSRRTRAWTKERDRIKHDVLERGFDAKIGSYVRSYGTRETDAALLILPVLEFDDSPDRVIATIDEIRSELEVEGGLLYRYRRGADHMGGGEGAFLPCSFWLVQALARTGRRVEATTLFEQLLERANDVGLFSEEIDPASGELLGNFPQAFTHATLVQAALSLSAKVG